MPLLITDIKLPIAAETEELTARAAAICGVRADDVVSVRMVRRALDARKKQDVHFNIHAVATLRDKELERRVCQRHTAHVEAYIPSECPPVIAGEAPLTGRVVVVGLGPAGLFCAHILAEYGYAPLVLERGEPIERRVHSVERYWSGGALDCESNVMFGEGGAGTFSDGKLTSRSKDGRQGRVLDTLVRFGAPEEIGYDAKPHIGTDKLRVVVSAMRKEIERLGGEVQFSTKLVGVERTDGRIAAVRVADATGTRRIPCGALILAIGQGARDTYRMLFDCGIPMEKKPFAVGVRIEHPQDMIDRAQLGVLAGHPRLGAASYALRGRSGARGVYTFCMCPGGQVIASASAPGEVVVNGMSNAARDGINANAAVVVQVRNDDTCAHPLAGLEWTEGIERAAFRLGGGDMCAPAQRVCEYGSRSRPTGFGGVTPTYRPGVRAVDLRECLPDFVAQGVLDGIEAFGRQLKGFDMGDAVLTAPETRTSAPVRILRDESLQSTGCRGLYPVGEGAGYAGGIVSAAIDGLRAAEAVISGFARQ